jgi:arsenate reductase
MPRAVRPEVPAVLSELGLDPSGLTSKGLDAIEIDTVQLLVTLCAEEVCPTVLEPVPGLHWPIPDPTDEAGESGTNLAPFRAARDRIRERLYVLFHG